MVSVKKMTPNEYIRKLQNKSETIDFTQDSEYIRLFGDEDDSEEFMESVYKKELGSNFEKVENGVVVGFYDSLPETSSSENKPRWHPERKSEYKRLLKIQARARGEKGEKES